MKGTEINSFGFLDISHLVLGLHRKILSLHKGQVQEPHRKRLGLVQPECHRQAGGRLSILENASLPSSKPTSAWKALQVCYRVQGAASLGFKNSEILGPRVHSLWQERWPHVAGAPRTSRHFSGLSHPRAYLPALE